MTASSNKALPYARSLIRSRQKDAVIQEYTKSSALPLDSQKAKWGSEESMLNRFRLGLDLIDWAPANHWLDIGCGTGRFFTMAEEQGYRFDQLTGVDITDAMIAQAGEKSFQSPARFQTCDLEAMPEDIEQVDLLTLVGVLQLCGCSLDGALAACLDRLKSGGQIFLTTKHLGWKAFGEPSFVPNKDHSWFLFDDIRRAVENGGIEILQSGGFLPREAEIVALEESHTLFIHGRKA